MSHKSLLILLLGLVAPSVVAAETVVSPRDDTGMEMMAMPMGASDCGQMEVWDVGMGMCMPLAMEGMSMHMAMLHGNLFGAYVATQGPRGRKAWAAPNMLMADVGTSVGSRHYFNLDWMGTFELWTFPGAGYPELLQVGESNAQGVPFIDAQHPHSSPIMGLTLSDTISLGSGPHDHLKVFFAPRGESTDGPVAFMHRPTGMVNPDAPLGHHVGQDVGHISSTVLGAALKISEFRLEASVFNGKEPEPTRVDLPLGTPDSTAARVIWEATPEHSLMASVAYVNAPEPEDSTIPYAIRVSASLYDQYRLGGGWMFHNTLIYGAISRHGESPVLSSFLDEFLLHGDRPNIWGRIEVLQRTPFELGIPVERDAEAGRWVAAFTMGYTHTLAQWQGLKLGLGGSATVDWIPAELAGAYGGSALWSAKVFFQAGGMRMFSLN